MITTRRILIFLMLFCCLDKAIAKEFNSLDLYLSVFPKGKHSGIDGNWLKEDRERNTEVWNQANKANIKKQNGYLEYTNIHQRCDFYKWFGHKTDSLGFETRWAAAAKITTSKLKNLLNPVAKLAGNSNNEIEAFVNSGNGIIFNDIWQDLKSLYVQKPLKGKTAEIWDGNLLFKEQKLIDPYYRKLSESSIKKLQKSLRKETTLAKILPGLEFEGNLLSIADRWAYGMRMMHYKNPHTFQ